MSDTERRGLVADLARRLALAPIEDLRILDRLLTRLEQLRFWWSRRIATTSHDVDAKFHLATQVNGVMVTRCNGRWAPLDAVESHDAPPVTERCMACQRAAWSGTELDELIAAVEEQLAGEDLARANLRDAARAEMLVEGG